MHRHQIIIWEQSKIFANRSVAWKHDNFLAHLTFIMFFKSSWSSETGLNASASIRYILQHKIFFVEKSPQANRFVTPKNQS